MTPVDQWRFIADLRSRLGIAFDFEEMLAHNYRRFLRSGGFVADVGAANGGHTTRCLDVVGPGGAVRAFEAQPDACARLEAKYRGIEHLSIINKALANFEGKAPFIVAVGMPGLSGLKKRDYREDQATPREITVEVTTLDSALQDWPRLDYIKMDIEGGEHDCLLGARETIRRCRPIISFECGVSAYKHYGKVAEDFEVFARQNNLRIIDLLGNDITEQWCEIVDRTVTYDFFYVPCEKLGSFRGLPA